MLNINEAVQKIKKAGSTNVRVVPMDGQAALTGMHKIEIKDQGIWITIVEGIQKRMAEDMVTQAVNKVIFG